MRRLKDVCLLHAIRFFRLRTSTERVARGFALGMIANFFPTFGFSVVVSGFLARLFGGNLIAGFVGGATLTFFWPFLFFLNIQVGGLFSRSPIAVDDMEDVTEQTVDALVWGQTFMIGAVVNGLIFGLISYFIVLVLYRRVQPKALAWLRSRVVERKRSEQTKLVAGR